MEKCCLSQSQVAMLRKSASLSKGFLLHRGEVYVRVYLAGGLGGALGGVKGVEAAAWMNCMREK